MWPVSARFKAAITRHPTVGTTVTVTPPGGPTVTVPFTGGAWTVQSGQIIRRTANLTLGGGSTTYDLLSTPGAVVRVTHGLRYGASNEYVPVITGEISSAAANLGDGTIQVAVTDFGQRLQRCQYLAAYSPATTSARKGEIAAAVTGAVPGTTVATTVTDTGTVAVAQTWTDRAQLVADLATDAGAEAFFQPDGTFLIRNVPQITDPPVYAVNVGVDGTLKTLTRTRPLDKLYNTVIVTPASLDGTQTWTQVVVQITDTANPRHPNYIGVAPYQWTAPTIMSTAEATAAGKVILSQVDGATESLALGVLSLPALDAGDVVTVQTVDETGATSTVTHIIDSLTGDLTTGHMDLATRSSAGLIP